MNIFRDLEDLEGLFILVNQNTTGRRCLVIRNVFILSYYLEGWEAEDQKPTSREVPFPEWWYGKRLKEQGSKLWKI